MGTAEDKSTTWNVSEGNVDRWDSLFRFIADNVYKDNYREATKVLRLLYTETECFFEASPPKEVKQLEDDIKELMLQKTMDHEKFFEIYKRQIRLMKKHGVYHLIKENEVKRAGAYGS